MGIKLLWSGLTLIECSSLLSAVPAVTIVGMVIMVIGLILLILDK